MPESSVAHPNSRQLSSEGSNHTSSTYFPDVYNDTSSSRAAHSTISADLSSKDMTLPYPDNMPPPINAEHCIDSGYLFTYVDTPVATSRGHYPKNGFSRRDNSTATTSSGPRSSCVTFSAVPPVSPLPTASPQQEHTPALPASSQPPPTAALASLSINSANGSDNEQATFAKQVHANHTTMFISPVSAASDSEFTSLDNQSSPPSRAESVHDGGHIQDNAIRLSVDELDDDEEAARQTYGMGGRTETASSVGSEERKQIGIFKPVKSLFKPLAQSLIPEKLAKGDSDAESVAKDSAPALDDAWCIDSGDAFADVESEGASSRWQEPRHSLCGRPETGSLKFLADLRRRQSLSSRPSSDRNISLDKSDYGSKDKDKDASSRNAIFSALSSKLALKLSPSQ